MVIDAGQDGTNDVGKKFAEYNNKKLNKYLSAETAADNEL